MEQHETRKLLLVSMGAITLLALLFKLSITGGMHVEISPHERNLEQMNRAPLYDIEEYERGMELGKEKAQTCFGKNEWYCCGKSCESCETRDCRRGCDYECRFNVGHMHSENYDRSG